MFCVNLTSRLLVKRPASVRSHSNMICGLGGSFRQRHPSRAALRSSI